MSEQSPQARGFGPIPAERTTARDRVSRLVRRPWLLAILAGLGVALGQAPFSLAWVALPALAGLFALLDRAATPRQAALVGWGGGFGHFILSLMWIVEPFLVEPETTGWMAPFALVLLPAGLALFWGAAFGLSGRLASGWVRLFLAAALLTIAETLRAFVLTGFPWALLGYVWIDTPMMQLGALIGPHGMTLLTALTGAAGAAWVGRRGMWLAAPGVALIVLGAAGFWGTARTYAPVAETGLAFRLRIVQPNAEQGLKWDPDMAEEFLHILLTQTAETPPGAPPELIVWPETALPYLLNGSEYLIEDMERASGARQMLFGAARVEKGLYYNSLIVSGPDASIAQIYDKFHLVPFGEYVPFGEILGRLGIRGMAVQEGGGFASGTGPRVLDLGTFGKIQPLICYEAIFPQHLHMVERADWILHITNDAWFGQLVGPYQHLAQVRMRAVEQGLPVVRAANTGVSAVIDAHGQVTADLGLGVRGFLDADLPPALPPTPYARTGDWPALVLMALLALGLALTGRRVSP